MEEQIKIQEEIIKNREAKLGIELKLSRRYVNDVLRHSRMNEENPAAENILTDLISLYSKSNLKSMSKNNRIIIESKLSYLERQFKNRLYHTILTTTIASLEETFYKDSLNS